jgi:hypothetical protein
MKVDMTPVEFDMKQLFCAFIDCYEALDYIADKEQSDNELDVEMARRVKEKGAVIAAAAIKSVADMPSESVFVLSAAMANIAVNVSNIMFQAEAMMTMEEDE